MRKKLLYVLIFNVVILSSAHADASSPRITEQENASPIQFTKTIKPSTWCPEKRMMVATVSGPKKASLRTSDLKQFTVYVGDSIVDDSLFRIARRSISVCIPASISPKILAYGPDAKGRGTAFSSTYPQYK